MAADTAESTMNLWMLLGVAGGILFYGRFYVQWIVSEIRKRSVMPTVFWYMSAAGSPMLLLYAFIEHKPLGALSHCLNIIIYARNINHIWKERKLATRRARYLMQIGAALLAVTALAALYITWRRQYFIVRGSTMEEAALTGLWLTLLLVGQALFAARFLIQWYVTERRRRSVVPNVFWSLSTLAAVLQTVAYVGGGELLFAIGTAVTLPVYVRNLVLIYRLGPEADLVESG